MTDEKNTTTFAGNIDLSATKTKRFTVDNDKNRVLELDTSDLSIISRLNEVYPKIDSLVNDLTNLTENDDESIDEVDFVSNKLTELDNKLRGYMDYIFNSNVSEVCAPKGSMFDPLNGKLRYEHIMEVLVNLYENEISSEVTKIKNRMKIHTSKYTKN